MQKKIIYNYAKDLSINNWIVDKIIQKKLKLSRKELLFTENINNKYFNSIKKDLNRIKNWEPLEYIIWEAEFYSLLFHVNKNTLVPRNDTEILVKETIKESKNLSQLSLVDIWTWSWNIAISIYKNINNINSLFIIDKSKKALRIAEKNIKTHNVLWVIKIYNWNLLKPLLEKKDKDIENNIIITANLPYIKNEDFDNMSKETIKYEPKIALFWWKKTWFELYEKLIKQTFKFREIYKTNKIILFIEIWFDQYEYSKLLLNKLWLKYQYFKDSWWIFRCIKIYF